jgi:transcriptional regulator of acetoin/glycerol metabolism
VVLRHLHDTSPRDVNRIKAAIEEAGVPIAVTVDLSAADEYVRALVAQLCTTVRLPSLREMYAHVPRLVSDILRELPAEQRATRFSSDALQLLMRWSWPGNVAELRRTVEQLARRRPGRTVGVVDLPSRMQQVSPRGLGMLESAEREAIITALQRAGGNRTRAAEALGIGRTTLYRKLQTYRIKIENAPGEAPLPG